MALSTVGVDVRLNNRKGQKFQPDVVGYFDAKAVQRNEPMVFVDFESPNSSDGRIPNYHLPQYLEWVRELDPKIPYEVITSLPDGRANRWELRYTTKGLCNADHKGKLYEICENPFRYWTSVWRKQLAERSDLSAVFFLNIDRRKVVRSGFLGVNRLAPRERSNRCERWPYLSARTRKSQATIWRV